MRNGKGPDDLEIGVQTTTERRLESTPDRHKREGPKAPVCTIIILNEAHPRFPLVIAANRDEFHARPATTPQPLCDEPLAVGGLDVRAGGTWMGATADGLLVGLTNQPGVPDPEAWSRGQIVLECLSLGTPSAIRTHLEQIDARRYNGFNLLFGVAGDLHAAYGRREHATIEFEPVPVGIHVLPNDRLDSERRPKVKRAQMRVREGLEAGRLSAPAEPHSVASALKVVLGDHTLPSVDEMPEPRLDSRFSPQMQQKLQALCIHLPTYGTRSSTCVALEPGGVIYYGFAAGPPCCTEFEDVTDLFDPPELEQPPTTTWSGALDGP